MKEQGIFKLLANARNLKIDSKCIARKTLHPIFKSPFIKNKNNPSYLLPAWWFGNTLANSEITLAYQKPSNAVTLKNKPQNSLAF